MIIRLIVMDCSMATDDNGAADVNGRRRSFTNDTGVTNLGRNTFSLYFGGFLRRIEQQRLFATRSHIDIDSVYRARGIVAICNMQLLNVLPSSEPAMSFAVTHIFTMCSKLKVHALYECFRGNVYSVPVV